jgi:hypothetical protein
MGKYDEKIEEAAASMTQVAQEMGIKGALVIMVTNSLEPHHYCPHVLPVGRLGRPPDPVGRGSKDRGSNYGAMVCAKLFEAVRTGVDSGTANSLRNGEFGLLGVIVATVGHDTFYTGFSGAPESEKDVVIARAGMKVFVPDYE